MLRQEKGEMRSLCDFVIDKESGKTSAFGCFAICVKAADAHEEGCCCPACSNKYEDLIGKAVRMTLAEAASKWLDRKLKSETDERFSIIKPAAGYSSCPDHTLKRDIFELLGINKEEKESCGHHHAISDHGMNIKLTESYAMIPEASICGTIFIHPEAKYHEIRTISQAQHDIYAEKRGMDAQTARRFLGHLLK
jgi:5-methyltetrahydrofolate--homocysteine methyltransferase